MNSPLRLHLVEPQPLLRSRLVQSLEAAGALVSCGEPRDPVSDECIVVLNVDGHSAQWNLDASQLARDLALRTIVTSASDERLDSAVPSGALGALRRPFSAADLLDFVVERLASPAEAGHDPRSVAFGSSTLHSDVAASSPSTIDDRDLATLETDSVDALPSELRAATNLATEVELDAVQPLHDMVISAYVDTLAEMLPTLSDKDSLHTRAALRALLVRFADELTGAE